LVKPTINKAPQFAYINNRFIISTKEHGNRVSLHPGTIDGAVHGALKDIVCPSGHAISNIDDECSLSLENQSEGGYGNRIGMNPLAISIFDLQCRDLVLS